MLGLKLGLALGDGESAITTPLVYQFQHVYNPVISYSLLLPLPYTILISTLYSHHQFHGTYL